MIEITFWSFVVCAAVQLLFFISTILAFLLYKMPSGDSGDRPGVSVIVCAKNELENLKVLLPNLLSQACPDFEIVLVDDKSTDGTYEYGIELAQQEERLKFVRVDTTPDHINNKKYAITLGVRAATNELLLLTDADCCPTGNQWIAQMASGFSAEGKQFVLGYSQYETRKGLLNRFIQYETLLTGLNYLGIGLLGRPYMGVGRNIAYKKSFFLQNNGFGEYQSIVGGDDDLLVNKYAKRKNTSFILSAASVMYSKPKLRLAEYVMQKTRHLSVGKYYKKTDKLILGVLSLTKILYWILFFAVIMTGFQTYFAIGGFLLVMVSLLTTLLLFKQKTGDKVSIWMLPLLDFMYIFYYISTGLKVVFTKKIRWK